MNEKYQPSPEETQKAEEVMTPTQSKLSKNRERITDAWRKAGLEGELHALKDFYPGVIVAFEGTVNGHKIYVKQLEGYENRDTFKAIVDDREMDKETSRALYYKYLRLGLVDYKPENAEILYDLAQKEVLEEANAYEEDKNKSTIEGQKEKLLKDLGL